MGDLIVNYQGNLSDSSKNHGRHGGLIYQLYVRQQPIQLKQFNFSYRGMIYNPLNLNSVNPQF